MTCLLDKPNGSLKYFDLPMELKTTRIFYPCSALVDERVDFTQKCLVFLCLLGHKVDMIHPMEHGLHYIH